VPVPSPTTIPSSIQPAAVTAACRFSSSPDLDSSVMPLPFGVRRKDRAASPDSPRGGGGGHKKNGGAPKDAPEPASRLSSGSAARPQDGALLVRLELAPRTNRDVDHPIRRLGGSLTEDRQPVHRPRA